MAADTIIHCYCMDEEIHENQGGAQYVPKLLREFIDSPSDKNPKPLHQRLINGSNN